MIVRPFALSCVEGRRTNFLSLRIEFSDAERLSSEIKLLAADYIEAFVTAGNIGALAGDALDPCNSKIVISRQYADDLALNWEFEYRAIAPESLSMIINMFHSFHFHCWPLQRIVLACDMCSGLDLAGSDLPEFYEPLPFGYVYEAEGPNVIIDLECERQPTIKEFAEFVAAWESWIVLASYGAFSDESFPPHRNEIYEATNPTMSFEDLQFAVEDAYISAQSFDSLVNIFHKLHRTTTQLVSCTFS